jgi:polar amino acid transport system substrate-binding protein
MFKSILLFLCACFFSANSFAQSLSIFCEDDKPLQFVGPDHKLTGFGVEVVQEIQKRVGNKDEIKMTLWALGLRELDSRPNTALFSMARTVERDPKYLWVGPIAERNYGLYVKADSTLNVTNLEEAKSVRAIGVYHGDVRDQFLTNLGFKNLDRADQNVSNFKKLMLDRVVMYAGSSADIKSQAESAGYIVSDVKLAFYFLKAQLFITFSKGTDPALVAQWNKALDDMKKDKTFLNIHRKYYPDLDPPGPLAAPY